jgi:uncharacterized membrane protein
MSRLPFGVKAIITLKVLGIASTLLVVAISGLQLADPELAVIETYTIIVIYTIFALLDLVAVIGLWSLARWAWTLTMLTIGVSLANLLYRYFQEDPLYLNMVLNVLMVFYLNQRDVQRVFLPRGEREVIDDRRTDR